MCLKMEGIYKIAYQRNQIDYFVNFFKPKKITTIILIHNNNYKDFVIFLLDMMVVNR